MKRLPISITTGLMLLFLLSAVSPALMTSAQTTNTWVVAFYPASYPSGTSSSSYNRIFVNFTLPWEYVYSSSGYAGFVLTVTVPALYYNAFTNTWTNTSVALQVTVDPIDQGYGQVITYQVWLPNQLVYYTTNSSYPGSTPIPAGAEVEMIGVSPASNTYNHQASLAVYYIYNGQLYFASDMYFPSTYTDSYGDKLVIPSYVSFSSNNGGTNPSFAFEGTTNSLPSGTWSIQWTGMQINGKNVLSFNAVAGDSQATGVGGTASVPSGLVESGMTLYQGASTFAYFSMGSTSAFNGLSYTQLSEGQSYQNIQFLNQETSFVNIPY